MDDKDYWEEVEKFRKEIKELKRYSEYEGTEFGEYTQALCILSSSELSEEFEPHYKDEVRRCLKDYQENYKFIEREYQPPIRKEIELVFIEDEEG